jgi:nucleotide-binding universal stress UspA family protein
MTKKALNKILVPLDGSKNSLRSLKFALNLAKQLEAAIIGLNVLSFPFLLKTSSTIIHKKRQESKKIIKQAEIISQKTKVPFRGITKVSSTIGKTIITISKSQKVDLIVIGSRGPEPEGGLFIGSIANYVIHKSKIPVTIVK